MNAKVRLMSAFVFGLAIMAASNTFAEDAKTEAKLETVTFNVKGMT